MKLQWVFCHGFGFNKDYWNNLKPYFLEDECVFIDSGYLGQTNEQTDLPRRSLLGEEGKETQTLVGIGHSLGLSKLIDLNIQFDYLIGLNSFVNFLGNASLLREERTKELSLMIERFQQSPKSTLRHFYKRCGVSVPHDALNHLDESLLLADLLYLQHSVQIPADIPMLILGDQQDNVVPPQLIHDNFAHNPNVTIEMSDQGLHGLGWLQAEWVAQQIKNFIKQPLK